MTLKEERRALSSSAHPRNQVGTLGLLREDSDLHAKLLEQPGDPADALPLGARRIRRVESKESREQLGRSLVELLGSHSLQFASDAVKDAVPIERIAARAPSWPGGYS
jgi:hypothetical protein